MYIKDDGNLSREEKGQRNIQEMCLDMHLFSLLFVSFKDLFLSRFCKCMMGDLAEDPFFIFSIKYLGNRQYSNGFSSRETSVSRQWH